MKTDKLMKVDASHLWSPFLLYDIQLNNDNIQGWNQDNGMKETSKATLIKRENFQKQFQLPPHHSITEDFDYRVILYSKHSWL